MAFQISPGVNVSEVDLTTVVPSVLTTAGAFAGNFVWGPAQKRIQVDQLISESSKQLGYSFEELIWALEVHHVVSSLIWIIILLTMV